MSKNPKFEIESLINKCTTELNTFLTLDASYFNYLNKEEKDKLRSILEKWKKSNLDLILQDFKVEKIKISKLKPPTYVFTSIPTLTSENVKNNLENIKNELLKQLTMITISGTKISTFNYLDYLHKIEISLEQEQEFELKLKLKIEMCKLWIIRNYLCYLLLCYATFLFENETEFKSIIKTREYKAEFGNKIDLFELGIFGSSNPTSDIDIGIRYMGYDDTIGLSYVISVVEDLFHLFIGVENSLSLDIEPYADMYILPNWDEKTKEEYPDMFFLNTSNFEETDFKEVLPYTYASIIRNYFKSDDRILEDVKNKNKPILYDPIFNTDNHFLNDLLNKTLDDTNNYLNYLNSNINRLYSNEFDQGKIIVIDYMQASYNVSRETYYALVLSAETLLKDIRQKIHNIQTNATPNTNFELTKLEVKNCMNFIMKSLIYRQESYICPATITHVVRTMQVKPNNNTVCSFDVNNKTVVIPTESAICAIGKHGYIISALEQYGYLFRFHNYYCIPNKNHFNQKNCKSKLEKYKIRLNSAIEGFKKIPNNSNSNIFKFTKPIIGGRRTIKMSRKKSNRRKKTRKCFKKNRTRK